MTYELTPAEIARRLDSHHQALGERVRLDMYERDRKDLKEDMDGIRVDIQRMKDSQIGWSRLLVGAFVAALLSFFGSLALVLIQTIP